MQLCCTFCNANKSNSLIVTIHFMFSCDEVVNIIQTTRGVWDKSYFSPVWGLNMETSVKGLCLFFFCMLPHIMQQPWSSGILAAYSETFAQSAGVTSSYEESSCFCRGAQAKRAVWGKIGSMVCVIGNQKGEGKVSDHL